MDDGFVDRFDVLFTVGYRAAFAVLGTPADAEDCAQEACARALVRWRRVAEHAPAWVARVATNLAIDQVRRRGRRPIQPPASVIEDPVASRRRDLVEALRSLPRRQREAVVLRHLVDLSEHDTAVAMGCSTGTVKSSAARGLDRLRLTLEPAPAWEDR